MGRERHVQESDHCRRGVRGNQDRPAPGAHVAARLDPDADQSGELHHLQSAPAGGRGGVDHAKSRDRASPPDVALQPRMHGAGQRDRYGRTRRALPRGRSGQLAIRPARARVWHERKPRRRQGNGSGCPAPQDAWRCSLSAQPDHCAPGAGGVTTGPGAPALVDELHRRWRRIQRCGDRRGAGRLSVRELEVLQTDQSRGPAHYLAAQRRPPAAGALTEPGKVHPAQNDEARG